MDTSPRRTLSPSTSRIAGSSPSPSARATSAPGQNAVPTTAASCSTARCSRGIASSRAPITARTDVGTVAAPPGASCSIRTSSRAKSGLPPDRSITASRTSSGTDSSTTSPATSSRDSSFESSESRISAPIGSWTTSGRAVQSTSIGRPANDSARFLIASRSAGSAQWMSSIAITAGALAAACARSLAHAAAVSAAGIDAGSPSPASGSRPSSGSNRASSHARSGMDGSARSTSARSRPRAEGASGPRRMPVAARTRSASARKVTSSP